MVYQPVLMVLVFLNKTSTIKTKAKDLQLQAAKTTNCGLKTNAKAKD